VQKMAYRVKPAVVRVSAFAQADFRYPSTSFATSKRLGVKARDAVRVACRDRRGRLAAASSSIPTA
jgi:hypothetical protein